jgi:hypothetical protein
MSSAGVAAKMALKSITAVSAGDLDIGQTAQAGLDQAAAPAPAAAAGAYNFGELVRASGTLPVVPATSSNAGRPAHPQMFQLGAAGGRAAGGRAARGGAARGGGRKRGRGAPPKEGNYQCPVCEEKFKTDHKRYHWANYNVAGTDGVVTKKRLCLTVDREQIAKIKRAKVQHDPQQSSIGFASSAVDGTCTRSVGTKMRAAGYTTRSSGGGNTGSDPSRSRANEEGLLQVLSSWGAHLAAVLLQNG